MTAVVLVLLPVLAAWIEFLLARLPHILAVPQIHPNNFSGSHGFPSASSQFLRCDVRHTVE
jgi:hypothetical protein